MDIKYYHYHQNNSGGSFHYDDDLTLDVVIAAHSAEHADERAVARGIYFDGVGNGNDCSCCGDRWCRAEDYDARDFPHVYGNPVAHAIAGVIDWTRGEHPHTIVHHLDGSVDKYTTSKNPEP